MYVAEGASVHKTILTFSVAYMKLLCRYDYLPEIVGLPVTVVPDMNRQPISYTANSPIERGPVEQVVCVASRRSSLDNTRHPRKVVRFCVSLYILVTNEEADYDSTIASGRNVAGPHDQEETTSKRRQLSCQGRVIAGRRACARDPGSSTEGASREPAASTPACPGLGIAGSSENLNIHGGAVGRHGARRRSSSIRAMKRLAKSRHKDTPAS
jgi:hypothetical protein